MSERTKLLSTEKPYVFESRAIRERKNRVRQFQCCVCFIFICATIVALVVGVSFAISEGTPEVPDTNGTIENLLALTWPLQDDEREVKYINESLSDGALITGENGLQTFERTERVARSLPTNTPSYRHQKTFASTPHAYTLSKLGHLQESATKSLHRNSKDTKFCFRLRTNASYLPPYCKNDNPCSSFQKYASYDGTCNNQRNPHSFGVAFTPFRRALRPDYADGVSAPRGSKTDLPSARTVSVVVHRPSYRDDPKFTVMLAVWGQFLDHDMTSTASSRGVNGSAMSCCRGGPSHPECFPVVLEDGGCMDFVRSAPAPACCFGAREQMNQVSAYVDGSVVYGCDLETVGKLREFKNGRLKAYVTEDGRSLLPISEEAFDGCNRKEMISKGRYCFMTGDGRANENLHLTSMHLLWMRQHNLLAKNLSGLNPQWDDERVFQEARKIVGAQMQHITYNEFLPILLGPRLMGEFDLYPQKGGFYQGYDDTIDASIANNFATSAFRFAHSLIPGLMKLLANDTTSPEFIQLHKMLLDPFALYQPGEMDRALRGAMNTSIQASDPFFTSELTEHLFETDGEKSRKHCGLDLVSLNIQRGRDHGLPSYSKWREHCGLRRPRNFDDLVGAIDHDSLDRIMTIYSEVDEVDLYTGSLSEKPLKGSILGPTVTCLLLDQFIRIKRGDRFWYENPSRITSFSLEQLEEIRKTTLAGIICENSDNVQNVQRYVMQRSGGSNENVQCANIARPDLKPWKEGVLPHIPFSEELITIRTAN